MIAGCQAGGGHMQQGFNRGGGNTYVVPVTAFKINAARGSRVNAGGNSVRQTEQIRIHRTIRNSGKTVEVKINKPRNNQTARCVNDQGRLKPGRIRDYRSGQGNVPNAFLPGQGIVNQTVFYQYLFHGPILIRK
jgi:hypothetical protein